MSGLTPEQQAIAEEASRLVPICVAMFIKKLPCLRPIAQVCDLESAAYMACVKAARTYDPMRGVGISAYFSVAMRNAMLREVQKEVRSQAHSIKRISLDEIYRRSPPKKPKADAALPAMLSLTDEEREWIEAFVFDGTSFRAFGRMANCDPRTAKKRLRSHLDRLRGQIDEQP